MTISSQPDNDDEALFADKLRRFNDADNSFRNLVESLASYKTAVLHAAECGVAVAAQLDAFFAPRDRDQKTLSSQFLDSQTSIRSKWLGDSESTFDAEVLAPIKSRLDEIPKVRDYVKHRAAALVEMQKRQKKLQSERKRDGSRLRDKQRRLKEISDRYAMFHDEVIQRFNYIDRNMGTFVTAPLRSLVTLMADVASSTENSLDQVVKLVAETPPITKELSPSAPMTNMTDVVGGVVDYEAWDDSYAFADNDDLDADEENDVEDGDTDSASARASARRPPRGRVRSADAVGKGPSASHSAGEVAVGLDINAVMSPRRGRSASSTPADGTTIYSPLPFPLGSSMSGGPQRESNGPPGPLSVRSSQQGEPYFQGSVATSAASSTSTDIVTSENGAKAPSSIAESFQLRRKREGGKGSGDTVGSIENLVKKDVLSRLVAIYEFVPQESNELEIHVGDVIEVNTKNDSGWWRGRCGTSSGYFPKNYTRELTKQEEMEYVAARRKKRRGHRRHDSAESRRSGPTARATHASLPVL